MSHVFPQHVLAAITLLRIVFGDVGIRAKARCKLGFSLYSMTSSTILDLGLVLKRWSSNPDVGSAVAPLPLTSRTPSPLSTSTLTAKGSSTCSHAAVGLICHCLSQLRSPFGCDSCHPGLELCRETSMAREHRKFRREQMPWLSQDISSIPISFNPLYPPCFESKQTFTQSSRVESRFLTALLLVLSAFQSAKDTHLPNVEPQGTKHVV